MLLRFLLLLIFSVSAFAQEHGQSHGQRGPWGGTLPVPAAPAFELPAFDAVAAGDEQTDAALREMLLSIPTFRNFRALTHGAVWAPRTTRAAVTVSDADACHSQLAALGVEFLDVRELSADVLSSLPRPHRRYLTHQYDHYMKHVTAPVVITRPLPVVGATAVALVGVNAGQPALFSCTMALHLVRLASIVRGLGYDQIGLLSAHRDHPRESYHTMGLAIDIMWLGSSVTGERLQLTSDFIITPGLHTCDGYSAHGSGLAADRARRLLDVACAVFGDELFSTVITPNYNDGHRNHFHFDVRPYDDRLFLR